MATSPECGPILEAGRSCWRLAPAQRVAVLVDGEAYFSALADAIERAQRSILLLGWDFHSDVQLRRGSDGAAEQPGLAALLDSCARRRPQLRIHVLGWDFAMLYALERQWLPMLRFGLRTHRRVTFRLDDRCPIGASHHEKIAVIDDRMAFCGGIDLTACRWDTREHAAEDARRRDPGFHPYGPFHDVQLAVDGEAARALGELARERWRRATDEVLPSPRVSGDPWPGGLAATFRRVAVGIARTRPEHDGQQEVREVERLYVDALRAASRRVYVENQYLTSAAVADVIAERLREPHGPEFVIVTPARCSGWLEETSMGVLRARLLERLRAADRFERLRVYHPVVPGVESRDYSLHAKVLVVDERLLRVGSANLNNRSMGLDSECDLAIESRGDDLEAAIGDVRNDLIAEHLGVAPRRVREALAREGSLAGAIDTLRGGPRTLEPVESTIPPGIDDLVPDAALLDPERPLELGELLEQLIPFEATRPGSRRLLLRLAGTAAGVTLLAVAWRFTPLGSWATPGHLVAWAEPLRSSAAGPLLAVAAFVLGGLVMLPVTALILASGLLYGWALGFATAFAGSLASAAAGYAAGSLLWRDAVRQLAGRRLERLSRRLAKRGVLSVAAVRIVPVAPFTVVNLVAGASHIGVRDFLIGTIVGMAPGTLALCLFADRAVAAVASPGVRTIASAVGVAILCLAGLVWLRRRMRR